jgi:hypothetical protein
MWRYAGGIEAGFISHPPPPIGKPRAGISDEGDLGVALCDQQVDGLAGACDIIHADIGNAAIIDRLEHADARRQPGGHRLVAEGQDAGEEYEPGRLVGIEELQIFQASLCVVLGMADQDAVTV